ncbi:MAG: hypothetical protein IT523_12810 [Burkholderiales bacterium]|nr:hypothetical protein [Pseudomonadota bacterium]MCC7069312.1 hypothetical protein [Burkholderiales bacterium]MCZ2135133.1 hypothetical protein [Burkholderiales bacterium]
MYAQVLVKIDGQFHRIDLRANDAVTPEAAREWLDAQVVALGCEPLRASGKLLRADKVLVVARDAGLAQIQDPAWGRAFAAAAVALLDKTMIEVDVDGQSLTY